MHQFYEQLRFSKFNVYVIDCKKTLLNAFAIHNSRAKILLCLWHIEQNINKNFKKYFDNEEIWTKFMQLWRDVINSHIVA